jgi:hypothetical protein
MMTLGTAMLSVTNKLIIVVYAERHYAKCHYAECHYAECLYVECRGALCYITDCCKLQISACLQQKCIFSKVKELRLFSQHFIFFVTYEWAQ